VTGDEKRKATEIDNAEAQSTQRSAEKNQAERNGVGKGWGGHARRIAEEKSQGNPV
jgi:hypothetical protein